MKMAKRDAADLQRLLTHITGRALPDGTSADSAQVRDNAAVLADRTSAVLGGGLTGTEVLASWHDTQILLDLLRGERNALSRCSDVELVLLDQALIRIAQEVHTEENYRDQLAATGSANTAESAAFTVIGTCVASID